MEQMGCRRRQLDMANILGTGLLPGGQKLMRWFLLARRFRHSWDHRSWSLVAVRLFTICFLAEYSLVMTGWTAQLAGSRDYLISAVVPFEDLSSLSKRAESSIATIAIEASPGELEPGSFVVTSFRSLKNITLTPIDLQAGNTVLPKDNVDVRVVKVWEQAGQGPRKTKPVKVGELLVKDDTAPFLDSYNLQGHYSAPNIPNSLSVRTDIEPGESKQFWVTVKVPQDAPPGDYQGGIYIESLDSGMREILGIQLKVLPIRLQEPPQDRIIYYRGSLDPAHGGDFVGEDRFTKELKDIRDHGFTGVTLYDSQERYVRRAVELTASAAFPGPIIFIEPNPTFLEIAKAYSIPALFYGVDEPNDPERIKAHLEKVARIRSSGGKVVVAINRSWALRLADLKGLNDPLDAVNFALTPDFLQWVHAGGLAKDRQRFAKSWYYWQIMMEKPGLHRLLSGFFLWRSRLDGIFPYVYQHLMPPYSPFDDFAPWVGDYRVHMVTYPSADGPIPTLQWEALREGINDLRYLTTLENLIQEARTSSLPEVAEAVARASVLLDELAQKIVFTETRLGADGVKDPIRGVGPREYTVWRQKVIENILDVQKAMKRGQ